MYHFLPILFFILTLFFPPSALEAYTISGTIFEDISGDALSDGDTILDDTSGDQVRKNGVEIYLYQDDGNGELDDNDLLINTSDSGDLGEGKYGFEFSNEEGRYYVVVDSSDIEPEQGYNDSYSSSDVWAEQTYGPLGGLCADGLGGTLILESSGTCYGGRRSAVSDDVFFLDEAEHVAVLDLNETNSDVKDVDFGFSFNVLTHAQDNDDSECTDKISQGSFRQFIQNANAISGGNHMYFVPSFLPNNEFWWSIVLDGELPIVKDDNTTIDGRAYTFDNTLRDDNSGSIGSLMLIGTGVDGVALSEDEPQLYPINKPELEIVVDNTYTKGIQISATNITLEYIALYGATLSSENPEENGNIFVTDGISSDNLVIAENIIGLRADGSLPDSKSQAYGIRFSNSQTNRFVIEHNLISDVGKSGISLEGSNIENGAIFQNRVQNTGWYDVENDGISLSNGVHDVVIYENYIYDNEGSGYDSLDQGVNNQLFNNHFTHNGYGSSEGNVTFGIRLRGEASACYHNVVSLNNGAGVVVEESGTLGQKISQNSIFQNIGIGIDLQKDGVSLNNGILDETLPNSEIDYPVFTSVQLIEGVLQLRGYVGSTSDQSEFGDVVVEVFRVEDDGDGNGEGKTYLGSCSSDVYGNFDCNMTTSLVGDGDFITATATDTQGNSSEFGANAEVKALAPFTCDSNAYVFYSDAADQPTQVDEIDLVNATKTTLSSNIYPVNINGIGYSVIDNFIWGYDVVNHKVTRSDRNFVTDSFTIEGLDPYTFHLGDVSSDGVLYLASAYLYTVDGVESDGILRLYRVDVNPSSDTYLQKLSEVELDDQTLYGADFAFHPKDNMIYMIERFSGHIVKIDPQTGHVSSIGSAGLGTDIDSHVQFFDKNGYFYFFYKDIFYRSDLSDPDNPKAKAEEFIALALPVNGDGARCAYASMGEKPILEISDAEVVEGDSGVQEISFVIHSDRVITLSDGLIIDFVVSEGSAIEGVDFDTLSGTTVIPEGESNTTLTLSIVNGDLEIEGDEDFFVTISSSDSNFLDDTARGVILNDDYNITFNGATIGSPLDDGNLTTQIVGQEFNVTLSAYNETTGESIADLNITQIDLVEQNGSLVTTLFNGVLTTDSSGLATVSLSVPFAKRVATLMIYGEYKGKSYSSRASDLFAIRPKAFRIGVVSQITSGNAFSLEVNATDSANQPSSNYNEANGGSFLLDYNMTNTMCHKGNISLSGLSFSEGEIASSIVYDEVGDIVFTISEILGSEFAVVDENDTNISDRLIAPASSGMVHSSPDSFALSYWSLSKVASSFVYFANMSDIAQMHARIDLTIEAKNAIGATTQNYNGTCYGADTNVTIHFDTQGSSAESYTLLWQDLNDSTHTNAGAALVVGTSEVDKTFVYDIDKADFIEGESNVSIALNFDRVQTTVTNPLHVDLKSVDITNSLISSSFVLGSSDFIDFYFGRLYAGKQVGQGHTYDAKIAYEVYCKGCDKTLFSIANGPESSDSIYWYTLPETIYNADSVSGFSDAHSLYHDIVDIGGTNQKDRISIETSTLPIRDRIRYRPVGWLVYNLTSTTIMTHYFDIELYPKDGAWVGRGEKGRVVDETISSGHSDRLDW